MLSDFELQGQKLSACAMSDKDRCDLVEICLTIGTREHVRLVSMDSRELVGLINCTECDGTGWWAYAAYAVAPGLCVPCKGAGRVYVGLY